jgi:hypothetical protein
MSSLRVVPVLAAEQMKDGRIFRIFRNLTYIFRGDVIDGSAIFEDYGEVENGYDVAKIYNFIKRKLDGVGSGVQNGDTIGLLNNLLHLEELYTEIPKALTILHSRMPRLLIRSYERTEVLNDEIQDKIDYYVGTGNMDIVNRLYEVRAVLESSKIKIMAFWKKLPDFFIRMPTSITWTFLDPQLFLTDAYLPYITGKAQLPEWTDPIVIETMNVAIKIYQTKIQTLLQKRENMAFLSLIFREHKFPVEILKLIVNYLPVFIVFELLSCETPCEYLTRTCEFDHYVISKTIF